MVIIKTKTHAHSWMQRWAAIKDAKLRCDVESLKQQLDQYLFLNSDETDVDLPDYKWDEDSAEVRPKFEALEVGASSDCLYLTFRRESGEITVLATWFQDDGSIYMRFERPALSKDYDTKDSSGLVPESAVTTIFNAYVEFYEALHEHAQALNVRRLCAFNRAKAQKNISEIDRRTPTKAQSYKRSSSSSPTVSRRSAKRRRIDDSDRDDDDRGNLYDAIAPFFKIHQRVLSASQRTYDPLSTLNLQNESVKAVIEELGEALEQYKKEKMGSDGEQASGSKQSVKVKIKSPK
ncbi:hypothetical protein IWZ03DRAFT_18962 [Phyllosticta citriasiana]|uniref:Uncharacterized protein n=1 Tax=Phyllosticta citriasiana TaxID=595635 RepID=A0ABR1L141_9PEZI